MLGRSAISALPISGQPAAVVPPTPKPIVAVTDGDERKRRKHYREREARRRTDLEQAFEALTRSPEAQLVQRAMDIARPALTHSEAPRLDSRLLSDVQGAQLMALRHEQMESLLAQEDEEFLQLIL